MQAVLAGDVVKGDVVIVRYEGPKGGPGMQEMLALTGALQGRGLGTGWDTYALRRACCSSPATANTVTTQACRCLFECISHS